MSSRTTVLSTSSQSWDLNGDGIRSESDAAYRQTMLKNITKGYDNGWLK